jgi:hypothetical protein
MVGEMIISLKSEAFEYSIRYTRFGFFGLGGDTGLEKIGILLGESVLNVADSFRNVVGGVAEREEVEGGTVEVGAVEVDAAGIGTAGIGRVDVVNAKVGVVEVGGAEEGETERGESVEGEDAIEGGEEEIGELSPSESSLSELSQRLTLLSPIMSKLSCGTKSVRRPGGKTVISESGAGTGSIFDASGIFSIPPTRPLRPLLIPPAIH